MGWDVTEFLEAKNDWVSGSMSGYQHLKWHIKGLHICYPVDCVLVLQKNIYSITHSGICFADRENKGTPLQHMLQFLASGDGQVFDFLLFISLQASLEHCPAQSEGLSLS